MTYRHWTPPRGSDTTSDSYSLAADICLYLHQHPGSSDGQIATGIGHPLSTVTGHKREAAKRGVLSLEAEGWPRRFRLEVLG